MGSPCDESEIDFLGTYQSGWFCKYPLVVVSGESVTPDQAEEIILRCAYNPLEAGNSLKRQFEFWAASGLPFVNLEAETYEEECELYVAMMTVRRAVKNRIRRGLHPIEAGYFVMDRISSCNGWSGAKGIVDWDGTIRDSFTVGKWPCPFSLREDLSRIAKEFPFLKFSAQLYEDGDGEGPPRTNFHVENGVVRTELADRILFPSTMEAKRARVEASEERCRAARTHEERDVLEIEREACVSTERLFAAIARVTAKMKEKYNEFPDCVSGD